MSDSAETTSVPEPGQDINPAQTNGAPDWFLQELVRFANQLGVETPITLQVGGMLVSGMIVSGPKYFEAFARKYSEGFTDEDLGKKFGQVIESAKDIYQITPDGNDVRPPAQFIHLCDAVFFTPGRHRLPDNGAVMWRGRVSEVSGFFLGTISIS